MRSKDFTDESTEQRVARLIKQLGSLFKKRREQAYAELAALPPSETLEALLGRITPDLKKIRGSVLRRMVPIPIILCFQLVFIGLCSRHMTAIIHSHRPDITQLLVRIAYMEMIGMMAFGIAQGGLVILGITLAQLRDLRILNIAKLLALSDNPRVVGPLTEVIFRPGRGWQGIVADDLPVLSTTWLRLLPRVTSAEADCLNASQRRCLREELNKAIASPLMIEKECRTAIALMKALTAIGDLDALSIVERATQHSVMYAFEQEVVDQAQESLRILQEMKERSRQGTTLLRGSEAPAVANELLRGVMAGSETDSQELLRAQGETLSTNRASTYVPSQETETQEVLHVGTGKRVE